MGEISRDLRYALRLFGRNPLLVTIIVMTLGIGIGANTAVFSAVDAILLKSLPYNDPAKLAVLSEGTRQLPELQVSYPDYLDWKQRMHSFSLLGAYQEDHWNVSGPGTPERVAGCKVSADLFATLGITPVRGRDFQASDDAVASKPVALISYSYWKRALGAADSVVGKQILLDDRSYTIIGVLPANLRLMLTDHQPSVYVPIGLSADRFNSRSLHIGLWVIGRLKPSTDFAQAQSEFNVIAKDLEREYPSTNAGLTASVSPLSERVVKDSHLVLLLVFGAVAFVLLIACVNVATLMLAWGSTREREISIRAALGATQSRLVRQVILESVAVAVLGGGLGLVLSAISIKAMALLIPDNLRGIVDLRINLDVLLYAAVLSLTTGLLCGCLPAFRTYRLNLSEALREGQKGTGSSRAKHIVQNLTVVVEVSMALVLLISAQLMVSSTRRLLEVKPGFDPNNLVVADLTLPQTRYTDPEQISRFYRQLLSSLSDQGELRSVSLVTSVPLSDTYAFGYFSPEGFLHSDTAHTPLSNFHVVDAGYLKLMGIPLLRGRGFEESDTAKAPLVAIINESMAKRYWPGQDAIGRRIKLGAQSSQAPWAVIVGIVADTRQTALSATGEDDFYLNYLQRPQAEMSVVARTTDEPAVFARKLEAKVWEIDRDLPISNVRSMRQMVVESVAPQRISSILLGVLAGLGLLLSIVGIYGLLFQATRRRTREIGIRMALGASRQQVLMMIMLHSVRLLAIGLVLGWALAFAAAQGMQSLLFSIAPFDPFTYLASALVLAAAGIIASLIPALYATKVDPTIALRTE